MRTPRAAATVAGVSDASAFPATLVETLATRLAAAGLDLVRALDARRYDAAVAPEYRLPRPGGGRDARLAVVVGGSRAFWPPFLEWLGAEPTRLEIGDGNTIREFCSFSTGTVQDGGLTRVGNNNWIMAYVHVAHDCMVGDNTIFANNATLAGHVTVGDWAILGGFTGVHQFVRVGAHSFCGVGTVLLQDLPPFVTVSGNPASPHGINSEGLKRRGFSAEGIAAIKRAYKTLYRNGLTLDEARKQIAEAAASAPELQQFSDFIADSGRGIVR